MHTLNLRLLSLSKSSLADSQFVAGIHPEADPEQSAGILSVLTGEKSLPEKWAVRLLMNTAWTKTLSNGVTDKKI